MVNKTHLLIALIIALVLIVGEYYYANQRYDAGYQDALNQETNDLVLCIQTANFCTSYLSCMLDNNASVQESSAYCTALYGEELTNLQQSVEAHNAEVGQ